MDSETLNNAITDAIKAEMPSASISLDISGSCTDGQAHVELSLVAEELAGLNRLKRHKKVNAILADFLKDGGGIHALVIKAKTPEEASK